MQLGFRHCLYLEQTELVLPAGWKFLDFLPDRNAALVYQAEDALGIYDLSTGNCMASIPLSAGKPPEEAAAALGKLEAMGKDEKTIASKLKNRLKKYNKDVLDAAKARNEGDDRKRQELTRKIVRELYDGLGVSETAKSDQARRDAIIDLVTGDKRGGNSYGVINELADELLAGGTEGSVYDDLTEAVDTGRASDVQDEIRRLRTAGKDDSQIKSKITDAVKEEYLAGNDHDREQLEQILLKLEKADGSQMYEEKNFAQWVKDAAKKEEQAKNSKDEWAGIR